MNIISNNIHPFYYVNIWGNKKIMINKMFSIYDFLGYLVPGIFLVTNTYWIIKLEDKNYRFEEIKTLFGKINGIEIEKVFVLIVVMYILGHIISYISSITIERYSIWSLGYPSRYLLGFRKDSYFKVKTSRVMRVIMRIVCFIFLLPITSWDIILCHSPLKMSKIVAKPLDPEIQCTLKKCICQNLQEKYQIFYFCHNKNIDFLRIIYHEIVEESVSHFPKIQNYVALYGFARTITLVLNISTYFLIIRIFNINMKNTSLWVFAFIISFSSFLMYCCYNKFLRKYNLEILMAYLVKMKIKPQINNCNKKCS